MVVEIEVGVSRGCPGRIAKRQARYGEADFILPR